MPYLVSISIGPVQEFIASARRSRDLWFGSWVLSELSKAAAHEIVNRSKIESLIFPATDDPSDLIDGSDFNVVNKILALVAEKPDETGKAVYDAMVVRLRDIRDKAFARIIGEHFIKATAEKQVNDLLEYFWAAYPLNNPQDPIEYKEARRKVESLLAARKATRNFSQVEWGAKVPKSSLDGQRESVIHEDAYEAVKQGTMTKERLRHDYGVRQGERLCGVGMLKRHGNRERHGNRGQDDSFFSTSHVAALPLLRQLTNKNAVDEYITTLKSLGLQEGKEITSVPVTPPNKPHRAFGRHDGHLLFEERLSDFFEDDEPLKTAKKALRKLIKSAFNDKRPMPYYALLLADGDRMGKAIDEQKSIEHHRELSSRLTKFAKSVKRIVEIDYQGSLVYSGGDDVLAFLPLHTVLDCARRLADEFKDQLEDFKIDNQSPTLSVGIAVAHHLEPLSDALRLVRAAEKTAKSVDGKNALAVTLSKRSGSDRTVKGQWGTLDQRLSSFILLHRAEKIPDGAAYELRDLALRLKVDKGDGKYKTLQDAMRFEAMRILQRKRAKQGEYEIDKDVLENFESYLSPENESEDLANELIIARIFADATELAGIDVEDILQKTSKEETSVNADLDH